MTLGDGLALGHERQLAFGALQQVAAAAQGGDQCDRHGGADWDGDAANTSRMQVYLVGGAVRDALLGLPVKERDWVVVGSTRDELLRLKYREVGRDFPVFLHPESHEEYALARRERKTSPGYRGFAVEFGPEVTLEQDLARRDLTINAIAQAGDGSFIDPFGGQRDLAGPRAAPCFAGLRRRSGAHPAARALRRALRAA